MLILAAAVSSGLVVSGVSVPIASGITGALGVDRSPLGQLLFGAIAVSGTLGGVWVVQSVVSRMPDPQTRAAAEALVAAARSRPANTELLDRESDSGLLVQCDWRGWCVTRVATDEFSRAWSELNLGEPVVTVPIRGYVVTRRCREVHVYDDVVPLRLGERGRPERVKLPQPSPHDVKATGKLWLRLPTETTPEEVLELAAQLRRADSAGQGD